MTNKLCHKGLIIILEFVLTKIKSLLTKCKNFQAGKDFIYFYKTKLKA